jgi:agmatinase
MTKENGLEEGGSSLGVPIDGYREQPIYTGVRGFLRRSYSTDLELADVVVTGVPFDLATVHRPGARFGPDAIRRASANLAWEAKRWPWSFNAFDRLSVVDFGDLLFQPAEPESMVAAVQRHAGRVLAADKTLLTFGGDHYISLPLLREHARKFGPVALLHFGAHTETYHQGGSPFEGGTLLYQAFREGLVLPDDSVQIGIRTDYERSNNPYTVLDAAWINDHGAQQALDEIRMIVGDKPCYISFDIDCLDPAFAPGTGTPVCGGLTTDCALKILRGLTPLHLVGMDLVEVAPAYDHAEVTALAAATLAMEFLYVLATRK